MRLFTGIAIGEEVVERLGQLLRELRPLAPLNWSPLENLHITTKFIGAWPEERLEELTHKLAEIKPPAAFPVTIAGVVQKPRMLFAGVHAGPELPALARQVEASLEPLGVAREQRAYMPHVTLGRGAVRDPIAKVRDQDFGTFQVSEFHLYASRSGSYEILTTFPLGLRA